MNDPGRPRETDLSTTPPAPEASGTYTLELVAEMTGVTPHQVLSYQEAGLVLPTDGGSCYDDDALRVLRRLEYLREHYAPHPAGLRLLGQLLDEVERLREELRRGRP